MERRKFVVGLGSVAAGGAAAMGSGAFTSVTSKRTASVQTVNDGEAYLGLKEIPKSPNESYVDYGDDGHLRIRMDGDNPTDGGGKGVNSDSKTVFKDLFKIVNQGKQKIHVFVFLIGPHAKRVGLFTDSYKPCYGLKLGVGDSVNVGLLTSTHGLKADQQLLNNIYIAAIGEENPEDGDYEGAAKEFVPEDAVANNELPSE